MLLPIYVYFIYGKCWTKEGIKLEKANKENATETRTMQTKSSMYRLNLECFIKFCFLTYLVMRAKYYDRKKEGWIDWLVDT